MVEQAERIGAGVVTGWGACRLHGAAFFDGLAPDGRTRLPVMLVVDLATRVRGDPAVKVLRDSLDPPEVVEVLGVRCTRPERAVFDAARFAGTGAEAVVALDMACAGEVTSLPRMRAYVDTQANRVGLPSVRRALELATEHSWSPNETRLRMMWQLEAGLRRPLVNRPVFDRRGRLLGYPDLLDVDAGLVGEFDGADHRGAVRHSMDVGREAAFRDAGLEVVRVTGRDLLHPERVVARILAARRRARWLPPERRSWTVQAPDRWDAGQSLEERLAHRDLMRAAEGTWGDQRP